MPEDFLTKIHAQVRARLRELDGVVAEYERLQAAAGALAASAAAGRTPGPSSPRRPRPPASSAAGGGRAAGTRPGRRRARSRAAGARATARSGSRAGGRRRRRAPRGANREAVLKVLQGRPGGAGASELSKAAGVGRVSTYQVLTRLEREQLVRRQEQVGAPALYLLR